MVRVCVEGITGAGKTAALEALETLAASQPDLAAYDLAIVREPRDLWDELHQRLGTANAASSDRGQPWALPLALRALLSHADVSSGGRQHVVTERGPLACLHVFGRLLFNAGKVSQEEWELFKEYYQVLGWAPDVVAYVHTPPERCLQRCCAAAGRDDAAGTDPDLYQHLKRLEFQYETMVRYCDVPVVRIDGTEPPDRVALAVADVFRAACCRAARTPTALPTAPSPL